MIKKVIGFWGFFGVFFSFSIGLSFPTYLPTYCTYTYHTTHTIPYPTIPYHTIHIPHCAQPRNLSSQTMQASNTYLYHEKEKKK